MSQLPKDIDEKIQLLPIISFSDSEEFQNIIFSDIFSDIFNYYKQNYIPDVLKTKPEIEQKISLYLSLTNQDESFVDQTDQILYRRPVPDIHTFLTDNYYMGYNNATLYNYWRDKLETIFAKGSPIRKVIFDGCIGSGKSTIARKAFVYVLYRLLCLRYARATFNIDADSTIANIVISMTLKQVYDTNLLPFVKLMETMPCFQHVMSTRAFENFDLNNPKCPFPYAVEKSSGTVFFPDNIILTCGSNQGHFTGYNVVNSFCDEINEKGVEEALALLNTLDNRFASRFSGSDLVFQSVVSSARTTNSPIGEYVKKLPKDPSILHLKPMLWEVKPDPNFIGDGTTFPVLVGNGSIPSRIIEDPIELNALENGTFDIPAGCLKIDVPTVYKSKFELQLDQSIQDIAGISTYDNSLLFRDTTKIVDKSLLPEIKMEINLGDNSKLLNFLPDSLFETDLSGKYYMKRCPQALRYVGIDLSTSGNQCDTGLCMLHKEWNINPDTQEKETIYVVDFIVYGVAKNRIDLNAIQNLFIDLVKERNVPIYLITADQYQSALMLNNFETSKCFTKVEKLSVDKTLEPYTSLASLIELGRVKVGQCDKLKRELEALIIENGKVTRTTELKDMADCLTQAVYSAQLNYKDEPTYQFIPYELQKEKKKIKYEELIDENNLLEEI